MNDALTISDPEPFEGNLLPYNYLPAALRTIATPSEAQNRIVFQLPDDGGDARTGIKYHVASAETLSSVNDLTAYLSQRQFSDARSDQRCILGPPSQLAETGTEDALVLNFGQMHLNSAAKYDQVAVIIDIGIAFWNDRFRGDNGKCRFKAMRYLNFDAYLSGGNPFSGLEESDIARVCIEADKPNGVARVVAKLGKQFPDSYFAPHGGAVSDALWHGTATADLMAGLPKGSASKTALYGIELPMAVLRDADGDNLTFVLTLLVEAALAMTAAFSDKPLLILLPWGFSAGLQDGSHPAAKALQTVLSAQTTRVVKMLAPSGNQLQDRCCARIAPSTTPQPNQLNWHLPPDDFSVNTLQVFVTPAAPAAPSAVQTVRIGSPHGENFVVAIKESHLAYIWRDGQLIGTLLRGRDGVSGPRLRLAFLNTGWRFSGQRPTPAGLWTLSFGRTDTVFLWVLRDDRDPMLDQALPRRASWLTDLAYRERDALGSYNVDDDPNATVVRSGTMSVLATAAAVVAVQANELMIGKPARQAFYSGRKSNGVAVGVTAIVDRDVQASGVTVAINGSRQRARFTGTSAAVAIHARRQLGFPPH